MSTGKGTPGPTIAHAWARALDTTAYSPMSGDELDRYLLQLVDRLLDALAVHPFSAQPAVEVGARLVEANLTGPDSLPATIEVLAKSLPQGRIDDLVALLGALAGGYASAMRLHTLRQQEQLSHALLAANRRVEAKLRATESRFREVFTSSAVGIAITDLDGVVVEANAAFTTILGGRADHLAGQRLPDVLGGEPGRRELIREDGDIAWVFLTNSVLLDGYRVTMVQDLSELHLLQDRLGHQLLHDALTGLANRQQFGTRLETTLGRAAPDASITLCHLGLDAFSAINSGHGHEIGDRLLQTVAKRLRLAVAGERALVARVGGDEFAILIEDSADTPPVPTLIERINAELSEPTYVDGHGIAVGASVGVVRQAAALSRSAELFRAAEVALRAAKASGRRQWVRYDADGDATNRRNDELATTLPAAWENGELDLRYLPVVRLCDRRVVAVRAEPCWSQSDSCLELAERVGLSVPLTPWLLGEACERLPSLGLDPPLLQISLSRLQSGDADLAAAVRRAISSISPELLEIAFDTSALLDDQGDATDNLRVLADMGVATALHGFTGGMRELTLLESLPARSVILANVTGRGPLGTRAAARLVAELIEAGVHAGVDTVDDEETAARWANLGVQTATGRAFGELDMQCVSIP